MAPHNPNGPLATAMNLHYAAAIPNFFILEMIGSEADEKLTAEILVTPLSFQAGALELPVGPGFGVDVVQEALDARPYVQYAGHR
jgi:galactonate dehydratase